MPGKKYGSVRQHAESADEKYRRLEKEQQFIKRAGWCGLLAGELDIGFRLSSSPVLSASSNSYKWQSNLAHKADNSGSLKDAANNLPLDIAR